LCPKEIALALDLPVIDPWFAVTDVDFRTILLQEPALHRLIAANIWWIRGRDRDLVVDSGNGVASLRALVPDLFERDPLLVVTHSHGDHMGGAYEFDDVWAHPNEAAAIQSPKRGSLVGGRKLAGDGSLDGTALAVLPPWLIDGLPAADYDPASFEMRPAKVTREIDEGDRIELGDLTLTVLHLPGHTSGSVALYDEHAGTLYTGDIVYDGILLDTGDDSNIADYVKTMERLRDLPVSLVHGGHKPSFDRDRLVQITTEYIERRG
jgi:glyoxylase-like metal-dependent hydrolase (beta-lactamase superfamily II)